jgi:hypothetical protein
MYIKNINDFGKEKLFSCKKSLSDWLVKQGLPLLAMENGIYYFAKTPLLNYTIKRIPWHLKLLSK